MSDTPSLIERHQKIGQLLALALSADHPALLDWAAVGFALQELSAAKAKLNEARPVEEALRYAKVLDGAMARELQRIAKVTE